MKEASSTPSLVAGSSSTDRSSEVGDDIATPNPLGASFPPLDGSITTSKEENTTPPSLQQQMPLIQSYIAGQPEQTENEQSQLLRQSLDVLDTDWNLGTMPGDNMEITTKTPIETPEPAASTSITGQVARAAKNVRNALKRPRDKSDVDGQPPATPQRRSTRKPKASPKASGQAFPIKSEAEPSLRQVKSVTMTVSTSSKPTVKKRKIWLDKGLYVGQERHFDPRLTERKNKAKRQSMAQEGEVKKENKYLPRPMFAGEKMLKQVKDFDLPWDLFSQPAARQPRPEHYSKTSKSKLSESHVGAC